MGLDINSVRFLIGAHRRGMRFGDVLMIGRQDLNVYPAKMRQVLKRAGLPEKLFSPESPDTGFAEPLFKALKADNIFSLDTSAFEGADFIHDMNRPVKDELRQRFDLVFDGGTLEHVFNFPVALQNCMEMLRPGGNLIMHTCANNWCGHGFYQFSPELFYTVLGPDNGFEVQRMILHVVGPYNRWYDVTSPQNLRGRGELFNSFPLQIIVHARRTKVMPLFTKMPQQSDYAPRWENQKAGDANPFSPSRPTLAKRLPGIARLGNVLKNGWAIWHGNSLRNRKKFRPVSKD